MPEPLKTSPDLVGEPTLVRFAEKEKIKWDDIRQALHILYRDTGKVPDTIKVGSNIKPPILIKLRLKLISLLMG